MPSFLSRYRGPLLLFLGGLGLIAAAPLIVPDRSAQAPPPEPALPPDLPTPTYPGARQPPAVPAAAAGLSDPDGVVGVVFRGHARAYALRALQGLPQNHVINDLVAGAPVTVTYSDLGPIVRVLTGPGAEPLDVNVTGFYRNELVLKVEGRKYSQKTGLSVEPRYPGRLPFDTVPHEVTTWKKWRAAHPETDVVVEVPAAAGGR